MFTFWVEELPLEAANKYHRAAGHAGTCTHTESRGLVLLLEEKATQSNGVNSRVYKKCLCGSKTASKYFSYRHIFHS